jgi:GNAT superfamily N-acetyltransferase
MSVSAFEVSHDVEAVHIPQLMDLFASAWWATQRTETEARGILAGSDIVVTVVHRPTGRLVGFARVLTDRTYLAVILDVIVASDVRGSGIATLIMDAVLRHPWVADVKSIELVCQPDLVPFYQRWGFSDQVGQSRLLRRTADPSLIGGS